MRIFRFTATKASGDKISWLDQMSDKPEALKFAESFLEQNAESITDIEYQDVTEFPELQ